jgi:predicted hydrocarbon binding protein
LHYPNRFARHLFQMLEAQMGETNFTDVLSFASNTQHDQPIYQVSLDQLPPDTMDRAFDFAVLASINQALNAVYGQRAGRGLAISAGRAWFHQGFKSLDALTAAHDPALSPDVRCRAALRALATVFTDFSDQTSSLEENDQYFRYIVDPCAMAWGLRAERPICQPMVGLLQACSQWAGGTGIVRETHCRAVEGGACIFAINKHEYQQKDIPNG